MNRLNLCLVILWSSFYITFGFGASLKYGQTAKNLQIFEDNLKQTGIRERNTRRGNSATLETHTHTVIGVFKELKKRETVQRQLLPSRENVAHGEALLGRGELLLLGRDSVKGLEKKVSQGSQFVEMKLKIPRKTEVPVEEV